MIQEDYGPYVAASLGEELLSVKFGQPRRGRIRFSHEAVNHVVRVEVKCGHCAVRSNAPPGAHVRRARNVELNDGAVLIAHKAVSHICPVNVESCDLPTWADRKATRTLAGSCAPTRRIERGDGAISIPQETVIHESRVSVESRDRPVRVDEVGAESRKGALTGSRARTRRIEDGNHALIGANVAVGRID